MFLYIYSRTTFNYTLNRLLVVTLIKTLLFINSILDCEYDYLTQVEKLFKHNFLNIENQM